MELARRVEGFLGIGAVKFGADFNGYYGGRPKIAVAWFDRGRRVWRLKQSSVG